MFWTPIVLLHDVRAHRTSCVCKRMDPLLNNRMLYKVCKNKNLNCVFVSVLRRTTCALGVIYFLLAQVKRNQSLVFQVLLRHY
jgi:hypothetical protein